MEFLPLLLKVILIISLIALIFERSTFVESLLLAVERPNARWQHWHNRQRQNPRGTSMTSLRLMESSRDIVDLDHCVNAHENNEISRRRLIERIKTTTSMATAAVVASRKTPSVHAATDSVINDPINQIKRATGATIAVPTAQLGKSSLTVSKTIQGYWQLAGGHGKYRESDAIQNMIQHYRAGITTLDTADIYGPSEIIIGKFIQQQQQLQQQVQSNIIPITKFCCFRYLEEIDRNEVRQRILKSCERLQVQKLPLVQFFWSRYDVKRYIDVALYLTELKDEGLIQEIGATNFDLKRLQELKNAGVPIVSHQVQLSAIDRRPVQSGMANWCAENDISLIGFGTVGSGKSVVSIYYCY
jgi:diketogulonate reductase-like aldo/keto reductase